MRRLFITFCISIVVSSCTIEKRRYLSGYHIEWNLPGLKEKFTGKTTDIHDNPSFDSTKNRNDFVHSVAYDLLDSKDTRKELINKIDHARPDTTIKPKRNDDERLFATLTFDARSDFETTFRRKLHGRVYKSDFGKNSSNRNYTYREENPYRGLCKLGVVTSIICAIGVIIWPLLLLGFVLGVIWLIWWIALGAPLNSCCCCDNRSRNKRHKRKRRKKRGLY